MSSSTDKPQRRYRTTTTNWKQYNAALKARGSLTVWFDKNRPGFPLLAASVGAVPSSQVPKFSDAAIQFYLTIKNLFGLALRQFTGLDVHVPYQPLLVDATGIKFLGEGEWKCKKHGPERRRQWRKCQRMKRLLVLLETVPTTHSRSMKP